MEPVAPSHAGEVLQTFSQIALDVGDLAGWLGLIIAIISVLVSAFAVIYISLHNEIMWLRERVTTIEAKGPIGIDDLLSIFEDEEDL